jgi:17beta-estradiol 17-dehydrogenase / very-long-chain 3-oxoacyl-CoA reductase
MKRYDGKGSWALITGSSDGLGKGYAMDLASRGFNIVIVARSPQKMQKVADEIKKEHKDV